MPPKTGTSKKTTGKTSARSKGAKAAARSGSKAKTGATRAKSGVPSAAGKRLVIVESPAKARTVGQILGNKYVVAASMGHVRDLPKSTIGVNTEEEFTPKYLTMKDKRDLVKGLKEAGAKASEIFLATDPDREGEAISWHLQAAAGWDKNAKLPKRVVFHEITKQAVEEAFEHPREIDMELVNAQQARRILDRLVGYEISPLLWLKVQLGLSAGRVQSVALRMIVEREREIAAFVPEEWWSLEADLFKATDSPANPNVFTATLHSKKGARRKMSIPNEESARSLESELKDASYAVDKVEKKPRRQRPAPPFITSTLQQEAGRKLRFTAQRTMALAQQLYEGLNVGTEGSMGLITYMRTDSVNVAETAVRETRDYVRQRFGKEYVPDKPRSYRTRSKNAQEAHEAIRPTSIGRTPQAMAAYLDRDQLRLYTLIWERMVASQMADALLEATTVEIDANCADTVGQCFPVPGDGIGAEVPGVPRGVHGRAGRFRRWRGRRAAGVGGRGRSGQPGTESEPAFHAATAEVHRGHPDQGDGRQGHRAAQHLRADHRDTGGARIRGARAAEAVTHGVGLYGHRPVEGTLLRRDGHELHGADGGGPGQRGAGRS